MRLKLRKVQIRSKRSFTNIAIGQLIGNPLNVQNVHFLRFHVNTFTHWYLNKLTVQIWARDYTVKNGIFQ